MTQTLQRMIFNLNGTHKPDAEIAAEVPRAIAQMIKDGVMKPENAPSSPITGFDDVNKFLSSYPSDAPVSAVAPDAAAPVEAGTQAPAKSEECPADRPWLCAVPGAAPAPQSNGRSSNQAPPRTAAERAPAAPKNAPARPATDATEKPDSDETPLYVFGANDVVGVTVFGEREATGTYTIMPDGRMSMPLVDTFKAIGTTVPELRDLIKKKLQDEAGILEPVVNVQLLRNNSKKYTIAGAVMRPGPVALIQETTLFDALVSVGFQEFAKRDKVILRRGKKDFTFNYKDALNGKGLEKNMVLQDGDYIIVKGD